MSAESIISLTIGGGLAVLVICLLFNALGPGEDW